jgi:hypothetical protein
VFSNNNLKQFNIILIIYVAESSAYIGLEINKRQRAQSTNAAQHRHSMQYIALACINHIAQCIKLAELFTALHTTRTTKQLTQVTLLTNNAKQTT